MSLQATGVRLEHSSTGGGGEARLSGNHPEVVNAAGQSEIVVPGHDFIVNAEYHRAGHDLVLTDHGREVVIRGFFDGPNPPALLSGEGARIPGALAEKLAGPQAPGQYAQAGPAQSAQPIGRVRSVDGQVTIQHPDGTRFACAPGTAILQGDVVQTGAGSSLGIVFVDKTTFALGENARMVIDELIYNPATNQGSSVFSLLQGVFVVVTGEIGKQNHDAVHINTPVGSIGIRGTEFALQIADLGQSVFTLLGGAISVSNALGQVVLNTAGLTTIGTSFNAPPTPPFTLPQAQFNTLYGAGAAITEQLRPFSVRPQQQQQQQNQLNPNELQQALNIEPGAGPDQQGEPGANKTFGIAKLFESLAGLGQMQIAYGLGFGPDSDDFKFDVSNLTLTPPATPSPRFHPQQLQQPLQQPGIIRNRFDRNARRRFLQSAAAPRRRPATPEAPTLTPLATPATTRSC